MECCLGSHPLPAGDAVPGGVKRWDCGSTPDLPSLPHGCQQGAARDQASHAIQDLALSEIGGMFPCRGLGARSRSG